MPRSSCSNDVIIVDPDTKELDLEGPSMSGQEPPSTSKVNSKSEVSDLPRHEKLDITKKDTEDPKPRIVLTFRSEKPGAKSSNMKIVSNEEKHDEFSPRRSSRTRGSKWDSDDDNELSPKKNPGQPISENDEASDSSHTTLKRSTRRRSKEFSENVLANAIARKEKSYETSAPTQRLSRRIKPTAKVLANKELRIGVESQNNARLGIQTEKSPEEGVRTRRSARPSTIADTLSGQSRKVMKRSKDPVVMEAEESETKSEDNEGQNSVMKLKHLCELGLKAINSQDEENETDNRDEDVEDEEQDMAEDEDEIDDDSEVINKLLEEDTTSDEDFYCSDDASQSDRPRRSTRLQSTYGANDSDHSSLPPEDDDQKAPRRRSSRFTGARHELDSPDSADLNYSSRRKKARTEELQSEPEVEESSNPAGGDEGSEAACPTEESRIIATCFCEEPSNIYAAPSELTEPVFCQAVEMVEGVRVGCSHSARREAGQLAAMLRAGPRAPYFLACRLHAAQLAKHMCCPACGLFCTQGIFYQCSAGHLFHTECGLPYSDSKARAGCPHCGVHSYRWQPANRDCTRVRLDMTCSNKRIFLPDQREQCTPSYLSFSTLAPAQLDPGPVIPEDLLPSPPIDLKRLCQKPEGTDYEELLNTISPERQVYDAIVAGETVEQLIPKIVAMKDVNKIVEDTDGLSCFQYAAQRGHLSALYLLQYAGASLDRASLSAHTPLMLAVLALVDKSEKTSSVKSIKNSPEKESTENMQVDEKKEDSTEIEPEGEKEKTDKITEVKEEDSDKNRPKDEDLMKVIRYLVAAGCDVNLPGPEGMTALHMASQHGSDAVCGVLLSSPRADRDPRDHGGWTPLVWATENKHYPVVRLLVREGADPCSRDSEGNAAIHWCALAGEPRALRVLLDAAPDALSAINAHADTPLHVAARQGHYACVVILLARGARTDVENSAGELPVEVCSGECQSAISLNMQMTLSCGGNKVRRRMLSSDISRGREALPVPCVNEVDDEPLPDKFTYVTQHVMPAPLAIDCTLDTMQGCSCTGSCEEAGCACCVLGVRRWAVRGRLPASFPYSDPPMLFECNQTCGCHATQCGNSVVTRLSRTGSVFVRTCVFRAGGACGWGLRATQAVPRGAPVALYVGELLALADADARAMDHYMFALDLKRDLREQCADQTTLCVDAAQYGGAARFVNHSCRPNLAPVRVFTTTRDLRLPHVALFATRDVLAGEELTFDYGDKFWSVKSKYMKCECGTPECRYPEKTTDETES